MIGIRSTVLLFGLFLTASGCRSARTEAQQPTPRALSPVSVAFGGFTNRAFAPDLKGTGLDEVSAVSEAVFQVTNHSDSRLTCQVSVNAFRSGKERPEVQNSEPLFLEAHSTDATFVPAFGGTNGWRYEVVISSTGGEQAFAPVTNRWSVR